MQINFRVDVEERDSAALLQVSGELDLASSPLLERELERAFHNEGPGLVIIDMSGLEFMDSTGLSVLIRAHNRAQETGHRLGVAGGSQQVRRLLSLTGVADRLTVVERPEELQ